MKQIQILNQFFSFKGKLGTQFCTAVESDYNLNVTKVYYISVNNTNSLPHDWQNEKKQHSTTNIQSIEIFDKRIKSLGMSYTPASTAVQVLNTVVPDSMGEEIHTALASLKKAIGGDVVGFVSERLQFSRQDIAERLAAEQVDAVALAIYNIEAREQGFIIGDQTGVGKGRIAAAMIRYAIVRGLTPIFITEKPNLFSDFYRDLSDIGCSNYRPFIVNAKESKSIIKDQTGKTLYEPDEPKKQIDIINKTIQTGKIPDEYDFVIATYTQFSDKDITPKKQFLIRMANDNICIFDESHNAGGSLGKIVNGRQIGGSNTATFFLDVIKRVRGVVFLSATFAKRPDNMPLYCVKTCIGETSLPLNKLVEAITKGGVALQEVLSSNVVKEGQMVRREKSKDHITVNYITLDKEGKNRYGVNDVEKEHKKALDSITELIRDIIYFQKEYVNPLIENLNSIAAAQNINIEQRKGTESLGVDNQDFASKTFNIITQLLFSIKSVEVAKRAVYNLKNGKKVIVAFANTMEAMLSNMGVKEGDIINPDYSISLLKGLESTLRLTEKDDAGGTSYRMLDFDELGDEASKYYRLLVSKIRKTTSGITISPIDLMKKIIEDSGFTVSEVTGRQYQLIFSKDLTKATIASRKKENITDAYRKFQNNELDCLFINTSGSTGASAHAIPTSLVKPEKVKQRVMLIAQSELNVSTEVQKRGRIDRTGQIYPPIYEYISSAIPAEKRLMMMLQKKLKSLDANTTSNQKQSKNVVDYDDFLNKYGDEVVFTYLQENAELNDSLDDPLKLKKDDEKNNISKEGAIEKVTGRVALLPTNQQEDFYNTMVELYKNFVDFKIQAGEYDLEVETMDLQAETISKRPTITSKGIGKSVFSAPTYEETCMVNVLKKPFNKKELDERIKQANKGKTNKEIIAEYKQNMLQKYTEKEVSLNTKWERVRSNISNEKGYKESQNKQEYLKARLLEIKEAEQKEIAREKEKSSNQYNSISELIEVFTVGSVWNFAWGNFQDMTLPCVCLGVQINEKSKNAFAPSNMYVSFAISDSTRYFKLNFANEQRQALISIKNAYRFSFRNDLIDKWEKYTSERVANREKRVIITGNILQAFDREDYAKGGKLISFTRKGNKVEKGILLRRDIGDKLLQLNTQGITSITLPIKKVVNEIVNLRPGNGVQCSGKFRIVKTHYDYQIITQGSSRQEFASIIENEKLIELAQGDYGFTLARQQWVGRFSDTDILLVIDVLQDMGINVRVEGKEAESLQNKLAEESGNNWKPLKWNAENIPSKSKKDTNTNEKNRLRLLELEMEMEIEIIEMEMEMNKYKSVAGTKNSF